MQNKLDFLFNAMHNLRWGSCRDRAGTEQGNEQIYNMGTMRIGCRDMFLI